MKVLYVFEVESCGGYANRTIGVVTGKGRVHAEMMALRTFDDVVDEVRLAYSEKSLETEGVKFIIN